LHQLLLLCIAFVSGCICFVVASAAAAVMRLIQLNLLCTASFAAFAFSLSAFVVASAAAAVIAGIDLLHLLCSCRSAAAAAIAGFGCICFCC
jgi:hypothetical protein